MKLASLFVCLVCCLPGFAKDQPEMHTAKVISQTIGSYNNGIAAMPMGTAMVAIPINRRSNIVVIETPTRRVTWTEVGNIKHPLILSVNGTVQFYLEKNFAIVLDSNHKKHKFGVIHMETIQAESTK